MLMNLEVFLRFQVVAEKLWNYPQLSNPEAELLGGVSTSLSPSGKLLLPFLGIIYSLAKVCL